VPGFDRNPREREPGPERTRLCDGCGRRFRFLKAKPEPPRCEVCNPGRGNEARLCEYCWTPFAQRKNENHQCCSASCDWLLAIDVRGGRRTARMSPVQPWDEPQPYDGAEIDAESRICIDCGASFVPNRGPGLPGRGRTRLRCYRCSPSKLV